MSVAIDGSCLSHLAAVTLVIWGPPSNIGPESIDLQAEKSMEKHCSGALLSNVEEWLAYNGF